MVKLADNPTHRSENRLLKKGEKPAMTASSAGHPRWTDEMLDELADSVSELRGSVADLRDSMDGVRLTANALLQIAAQQQRNMDEVRQREGRKTSHDKKGWGTDEMDR
jgi:outer membrane murein-binding lipoprotein Lpp